MLGFSTCSLEKICIGMHSWQFFGTQAFVIIALHACLLSHVQWALVFSISLISLGTASAVIIESGTPGWSTIGTLAFMASALTEASQMGGTKVLLGQQKVSQMHFTYLQGSGV